MNVGNLLWIFYFAAHTAAGIVYLIFGMVIYGIWETGPWAWAIPAGCLALLVLDLTGRLSLRGSGAKLLASLALPVLCGCVELLLWDDSMVSYAAPAVRGYLLALPLLAGYVLLREEKTELPLSRAKRLLLQGNNVSVVIAVWLLLSAGLVLFMATFGLPVSLFVGWLISSRNGFLDYGWVKGSLTGLLILYLFQCLWYWRGTRLARKENPALDDGFPLIALLIPVWNMVQVQKLARALQMQGVKDFY